VLSVTGSRYYVGVEENNTGVGRRLERRWEGFISLNYLHFLVPHFLREFIYVRNITPSDECIYVFCND